MVGSRRNGVQGGWSRQLGGKHSLLVGNLLEHGNTYEERGGAYRKVKVNCDKVWELLYP